MMPVIELLGPSAGGIRRHVAALAADLDDAGWSVTVAGPAGVLPMVAPVAVPAGLSPLALRRARAELRALVAPDSIVHAHGLKAGWVAIGVARDRTVLTVHNVVLAGGARGAFLRLLERRVVRRSAAVIATSREIADRFAGVEMEVIEPVHDVVAPTRGRDEVRQELGATGPLVVSVGRLHAQKSMDVLIRAAASLVARRPDLRVVIAGDGPERDRLQHLIDSCGLAQSVRLLGARSDVTDLMGAADTVVVTSSWESGPLTLLEAGTVGAPVVTTPVGFAPDVVHDGVSGRVVPIGDVEATAEAIMSIVDDPTMAATFGAALRDAVRPRLDRAAPLAAVTAVYARVAGPR